MWKVGVQHPRLSCPENFNRLWTEWDRCLGDVSEVNKFESGLLGLRGLYAPLLDTCSVYS